MNTFTDILAMIKFAERKGTIQSDTASWLRGLCQYGGAGIAASYLKKVQPYRVDQANNCYRLL